MIRYEIDERVNAVVAKATGRLTDDDLAEYRQSLLGDDRFAPSMNELFDCTEVDHVDLSVRAMYDFAHTNPFGSGSKRAIVVHEDAALLFGMFRIYQSVSDPQPDELNVLYDNLEEAARWVGLGASR